MNATDSRLPIFSGIGLAAVITSLVLSVYWSIYHPAQSMVSIMGLFTLMLLGVGGCLWSMTENGLENTQPNTAARTRLNKSLVSAAFSMALALPTICLLTAQSSFVDARKNLDGQMPAIAIEVSELLRANPADVWGVAKKTNGITPVSLNTHDLLLFEKASLAGIQSEEIDRVLANGMVLRGDKEALVETLLTVASTEQSGVNVIELTGLLAAVDRH